MLGFFSFSDRYRVLHLTWVAFFLSFVVSIAISTFIDMMVALIICFQKV